MIRGFILGNIEYLFKKQDISIFFYFKDQTLSNDLINVSSIWGSLYSCLALNDFEIVAPIVVM